MGLQRHWQLNAKDLEERSKCRYNQRVSDAVALLKGDYKYPFDSICFISPEILFYLRVYPYTLSEDQIMPLEAMFEEFGFVAPPKGKGEGPSVTAAGYGVVPHKEPSDAEIAFNSGHPASISNRVE